MRVNTSITLHLTLSRKGRADRVLFGCAREQRVDQSVHAQPFLAVDPRLATALNGIQKVTPHCAMIVVREGHWVGTRSASRTIG